MKTLILSKRLGDTQMKAKTLQNLEIKRDLKIK